MFSDPEKNVRQLQLAEGLSVADLGAGSGFYTLAVAKKVGENGRVYAIDVQQEMLDRILVEAAENNLANIRTVLGDAEVALGTRLRDASVDAVIVANTFFQVDDKAGLAQEAKRITKKGGRLLLVDWTDSFGGLGPQPEHVVTANVARPYFEKAGFVFVTEFSAGEHHYGIVFHHK